MKLKKSLKGVGDVRYAGQCREVHAKYGKSLGGFMQAKRVISEIDKAPEEPKGRYNGRCNVTACQRPGSKIFMEVENAYYCVSCARKMIEWDEVLVARGEQSWRRFPQGLMEDGNNRQH
jgi:hypothetical protein